MKGGKIQGKARTKGDKGEEEEGGKGNRDSECLIRML